MKNSDRVETCGWLVFSMTCGLVITHLLFSLNSPSVMMYHAHNVVMTVLTVIDGICLVGMFTAMFAKDTTKQI